MAATYLVVAYGGAYYGQIPYAATDADSLPVALAILGSYTPNIDKTGKAS